MEGSCIYFIDTGLNEEKVRTQFLSRGHKFSILEDFLSIRDFTSRSLTNFPSDLVGVVLIGARPLHLAGARPFGRLKASLGLSLLRCAAQMRACLWQAEQAHHILSKEKQEVPAGELPVFLIVCGFWQGVSYSGAHPVFYFAFNLLAHGSRLHFSSIPPGHHSKSSPHSLAGHCR